MRRAVAIFAAVITLASDVALARWRGFPVADETNAVPTWEGMQASYQIASQLWASANERYRAAQGGRITYPLRETFDAFDGYTSRLETVTWTYGTNTYTTNAVNRYVAYTNMTLELRWNGCMDTNYIYASGGEFGFPNYAMRTNYVDRSGTNRVALAPYDPRKLMPLILAQIHWASDDDLEPDDTCTEWWLNPTLADTNGQFDVYYSMLGDDFPLWVDGEYSQPYGNDGADNTYPSWNTATNNYLPSTPIRYLNFDIPWWTIDGMITELGIGKTWTSKTNAWGNTYESWAGLTGWPAHRGETLLAEARCLPVYRLEGVTNIAWANGDYRYLAITQRLGRVAIPTVWTNSAGGVLYGYSNRVWLSRFADWPDAAGYAPDFISPSNTWRRWDGTSWSNAYSYGKTPEWVQTFWADTAWQLGLPGVNQDGNTNAWNTATNIYGRLYRGDTTNSAPSTVTAAVGGYIARWGMGYTNANETALIGTNATHLLNPFTGITNRGLTVLSGHVSTGASLRVYWQDGARYLTGGWAKPLTVEPDRAIQYSLAANVDEMHALIDSMRYMLVWAGGDGSTNNADIGSGNGVGFGWAEAISNWTFSATSPSVADAGLGQAIAFASVEYTDYDPTATVSDNGDGTMTLNFSNQPRTNWTYRVRITGVIDCGDGPLAYDDKVVIADNGGDNVFEWYYCVPAISHTFAIAGVESKLYAYRRNDSAMVPMLTGYWGGERVGFGELTSDIVWGGREIMQQYEARKDMYVYWTHVPYQYVLPGGLTSPVTNHLFDAESISGERYDTANKRGAWSLYDSIGPSYGWDDMEVYIGAGTAIPYGSGRFNSKSWAAWQRASHWVLDFGATTNGFKFLTR